MIVLILYKQNLSKHTENIVPLYILMKKNLQYKHTLENLYAPICTAIHKAIYKVDLLCLVREHNDNLYLCILCNISERQENS